MKFGPLRRASVSALAALAVVFGTLIPTKAAAATPVPQGTQALAQQLLASGRVTGATAPMEQLRAYSNGRMQTHVIKGQTRSCQIDPAILLAMKRVVVDRGFSVRISSLNRYCINQLTASGESSYHWRNGGGHAVDISVVNGVTSTGNTSQDRALISAMFAAMPTPAGLGQLNCHGRLAAPSGWTQFNDTCNHNHFEYRGGTFKLPAPNGQFDVNGDGKADLLAISRTHQLTVYNGDGSGRWTAVPLGLGWGTTRTIVHGDYDNDGRGDVIAVRDDGTLWFYRGNGANGFSSGSQVGHGWKTMSLVTGGVDFNGDGHSDLVARTSTGRLNLYKGSGNGGFPGAVEIGHGWGDMTALVAGDFSGDGLGDILARDPSGRLQLYVGNGTGLNAPIQVGHGWNGMTAITGGADFGTDGSADLLARDAAGDLWLYPGLGTKGFGSRVKVGNGWNMHRLIN